jgi:hypothetical protein
MNHMNAGPQDGEGEISKRELTQSPPSRKKDAKNGLRFNVNWAAIGVVVTLIGLYLTYAGVKHIWPFSGSLCSGCGNPAKPCQRSAC